MTIAQTILLSLFVLTVTTGYSLAATTKTPTPSLVMPDLPELPQSADKTPSVPSTHGQLESPITLSKNCTQQIPFFGISVVVQFTPCD